MAYERGNTGSLRLRHFLGIEIILEAGEDFVDKRGLAGADGEVLLHFLALFAAEGRIGDDDVEAVLFLHVGEVLGESVAVDDVGCFDAVQDHVHYRDDVGEGLLFFGEEGFGFEAGKLCGRELVPMGLRGLMRPMRPIPQIVSPIPGATTHTMARVSGRGV